MIYLVLFTVPGNQYINTNNGYSMSKYGVRFREFESFEKQFYPIIISTLQNVLCFYNMFFVVKQIFGTLILNIVKSHGKFLAAINLDDNYLNYVPIF